MIDIKVTTCAPNWPWARQLPGGGPDWGPFRFHIDTDIEQCDAWFVFESLPAAQKAQCPPDRTVFITGEPDSIGGYQPDFLRQFSHVVSGRNDIVHPRQWRLQQAHPWFIEKSFDELVGMPTPEKTRNLCVITSDKAFTEGHQKRLEFTAKLKDALGDRIDVYGRGFNDFDSKWALLSPYRYAVVIENFAGDDFLTEKLPDAWLAHCLPFFHGCPNLDRYFPRDGYIAIDINAPVQSIETIARLSIDSRAYDECAHAIARARTHYLHHQQFFANLMSLSKALLCVPALQRVEKLLLPNGQVEVPRFAALRNKYPKLFGGL